MIKFFYPPENKDIKAWIKWVITRIIVPFLIILFIIFVFNYFSTTRHIGKLASTQAKSKIAASEFQMFLQELATMEISPTPEYVKSPVELYGYLEEGIVFTVQNDSVKLRADDGFPEMNTDTTKIPYLFKEKSIMVSAAQRAEGNIYYIASTVSIDGRKESGKFAVLRRKTQLFRNAFQWQQYIQQLAEKKKRLASGYFPEVTLRGINIPVGQCEVTEQTNGYKIVVPTGPYLINQTGIKVEAGKRLRFKNAACHNVRGGDPNDCDGANALVKSVNGWTQNPVWLEGRELANPNAKFMSLVMYFLDPATGIVTPYQPFDGMIAPKEGYLFFGANEPFRGADRNSAETNKGNYSLLFQVEV